jgi:hypothetical protein
MGESGSQLLDFFVVFDFPAFFFAAGVGVAFSGAVAGTSGDDGTAGTGGASTTGGVTTGAGARRSRAPEQMRCRRGRRGSTGRRRVAAAEREHQQDAPRPPPPPAIHIHGGRRTPGRGPLDGSAPAHCRGRPAADQARGGRLVDVQRRRGRPEADALAAITSGGIGNRPVLDAIFSRRFALVLRIRSANSRS